MANKRSARVIRAISSYSRSCSAGSRSSKPGEDTSAKILVLPQLKLDTLPLELTDT